MRFLLDTHVWLWQALDPQRLRVNAREMLEDTDNELWLSAYSTWEAHLLAERGRLAILGGVAPADWIQQQLLLFPLRDAPVTRSIALSARTLDLATNDPADRFIAATARELDLQLVTADAVLLTAGACAVLSA
jgi:PIN domain nuclease of toxin-antitoxin system